MHFIWSVGYSAIWCLVQAAGYKNDKYVSCIFPFFWKSYKAFQCDWASCMQPHPYKNLHWYPLTSSKNIWPKISVAYFAKWFQSIFTVSGWRIILSISRCWPLHAYSHIIVKRPYFEVLIRPEREIISPNPARDRHLFLKPDLGLKAKLTEGVKT